MIFIRRAGTEFWGSNDSLNFKYRLAVITENAAKKGNFYGRKKEKLGRASFCLCGGRKEKMILSVDLSVLSVILGLVPFYCMYRLICLYWISYIVLKKKY